MAAGAASESVELAKKPAGPVPLASSPLSSPAPSAATPLAAPEASPEHAPTAPEGGAAPPPPGQPGAGGVDRLPTQVGGPGQAPPPVPPAAYGYPQQHPQPAAYGPPQGGGWNAGPSGYALGSTPPYGPAGHGTPPYGPHPGSVGATPPYGPGVGPQPDPPRGNGRSTAALIAVALVVALAAGGSVYALMNRDADTNDDNKASPSTSAPTTPGPSTSGPSDQPTTSASTTQAPEDGGIPSGYLGTWDADIDNATGHNTRRLVIQQGEVGDTVLSLTADGPAGDGTYHCVFEAELASAPTGDGPLKIGPSTVTVGEPASSCSPGAASEVTLLPDGRLRRVNTDSGESLTYTKSD